MMLSLSAFVCLFLLTLPKAAIKLIKMFASLLYQFIVTKMSTSKVKSEKLYADSEKRLLHLIILGGQVELTVQFGISYPHYYIEDISSNKY